ncbi:arsenate reductase (glutaredoxin) [Tropicibacter sp. Alg240-R139]|uniref:arsenate reductase (glutaredoxin) n=1 Tax=Tropicibacter sp. Alg240-R139 TaxID=2305991 RepID=UPI0013DF616D|nr:arsenate reductase (glutaredoxin) [Tropicibacter sp. Alg240-R139]
MIEYWHNPRCSKSRQGLELLAEKGAEITLRKYLEDAPTLDELRATQAALDVAAISMMRTSEKTFEELGLSKDLDDTTLLQAMADHPILIERPLGKKGDKAAIGRPPEKLLDLL